MRESKLIMYTIFSLFQSLLFTNINRVKSCLILFILNGLLIIFRQALHGPLDRIVAVMGMDVTLGYFYKLVINQIPVCESSNIR